jgi:hypothetical protein
VNTTKIEGYLINLGLSFEGVDENAWLINDFEEGLEQVFVITDESLVVLRVRVMDIPTENREAFFLELLRLNAADLIHGAYAIDGDDVILLDTLVYDTMDFEEFQASLDAIGLALAQHYTVLSKYRKNSG